MRKPIIRSIALLILVDGLSRTVQYLRDPHANLGFLGVRFLFSPFDLAGWVITAALLVVAFQLFRLRESGRYWAAILYAAYFAVNILVGVIGINRILSKEIKDTSLRFDFFGWHFAPGILVSWLLFLTFFYIFPAAILYFLTHPATRSLFTAPANAAIEGLHQDADLQDLSDLKDNSPSALPPS